MRRLIPSVVLSLAATHASAAFYVDYQGLDKVYASDEQPTASPPTVDAAPAGPPEGFRILADRNSPILRELGKGEAEVRYGFGLELPLSEAVQSILPQGWIAYISTEIHFEEPVDWNGGVPWTDALKRIGSNYSLGFIVDWEANHVRVVPRDSSTYSPSPARGEPTKHIERRTDEDVMVIDGVRYRVRRR